MIGSAAAVGRGRPCAASEAEQRDAGRGQEFARVRYRARILHEDEEDDGHAHPCRWDAGVLWSVAGIAARHGPFGAASSSPAEPPVAARRAAGAGRVAARCRPRTALKTFHMAPGYRVELVASEPLIQDPVAIDWDPDGRLWAVEMPGYMADIAGSNEHDPIGRVVVLEDTQRRRQDGQAHGVRGRPRAGASGQGARPRRARRRAAQPLADARHERRSARRHQGARHRSVTDGWRAIRRTTRTASTGRSTTGCTWPDRPISSCG